MERKYTGLEKLFCSLPKLKRTPQERNSIMEIRLHLTFLANWDKFDKVWKRRIHFKSDVSLLSQIAVVDAEAPYQRRDDENVKKH